MGLFFHRNWRFFLSMVLFFAVGYFIGDCSYHGIKALIKSMVASKSPSEKSSEENILDIEVIDTNLFSRHPLDELTSHPAPAVWPSLNSKIENPSSKNARDNTVWVVTPTFRRSVQFAELTRLAQALYPVRSFVYWLVIDEYEKGSELNMKNLDQLLKTFPIRYILQRSTPRSGRERVVFNPHGVDARNDALKFFRENLTLPQPEDVVYFADDDNTYDSEIFKQMKETTLISMWPTGAITTIGISSPLVRNGKVDGFIDGFIVNRKFPVDFAMFAITVNLIRENPDVTFKYVAGYIETYFLQHILEDMDGSIFSPNSNMDDLSYIKPLANNCTDILTWHTKNVLMRHHMSKTQKKKFHLAVKKFQNIPNLAKLYNNYYWPQ